MDSTSRKQAWSGDSRVKIDFCVCFYVVMLKHLINENIFEEKRGSMKPVFLTVSGFFGFFYALARPLHLL